MESYLFVRWYSTVLLGLNTRCLYKYVPNMNPSPNLNKRIKYYSVHWTFYSMTTVPSMIQNILQIKYKRVDMIGTNSRLGMKMLVQIAHQQKKYFVFLSWTFILIRIFLKGFINVLANSNRRIHLRLTFGKSLRISNTDMLFYEDTLKNSCRLQLFLYFAYCSIKI